MSVSRVLQKLKSTARKRPLLFNSLIYGSFYTGAEFAQQTYGRMSKLAVSPASTKVEQANALEIEIEIETETETEIEKPVFGWIKKLDAKLGLLDEDTWTGAGSYNWAQLKRYAIYGCFIAGPVLHGWYKWLDAFYKGKAMKVVLAKLLVDQFVLSPPLIVLFFTSMSLMEGKSNALHECKAKFVQTFKTSCMYWLPVQFLNFLLIPPALRVSFVSVAAFCWVNILCYLKNTPVSEYSNGQIKY